MASGLIVPLIVIVRLLPAPALRLAPVKTTLLPVEPFVPQLAAPIGVQLTVTPVIAAGTRSDTSKAGACDGPAFVIVRV